jgi:hypothetical protein
LYSAAILPSAGLPEWAKWSVPEVSTRHNDRAMYVLGTRLCFAPDAVAECLRSYLEHE